MRLLWLDSKSRIKTDQYKKNNRPIYEHTPFPKTTPPKIPGNNIRLIKHTLKIHHHLNADRSEPSYNSIDSFDTAKIGFWKKGHLSSKGGSSGSTLPKCVSFPA